MPNLSFRKLKQKKIRLSASVGKRRFYFFLAALIASLLVLAGSMLDESLGLPYIAIFVKLGLAWLAFMLARQSGYLDPAGDGSLFTPYAWLILPPLVFVLLSCLGPIRFTAAWPDLLFSLLGVLGTALWEELYFRLWGRILFEEEGKYRPLDFLFIALTFGAMHLINLAAAPFATVAVQAMLAVVTALFLQTILAGSGSLRLVIVFHFLINGISVLFGRFLVPDAGQRFFPVLESLAPLLLGAYYALSAAVSARRQKLFIKRL
ncbi:MAG: CPBP family intramembrane metalloprotease [Lachnospiraceae bacterium]|nr:CPBP family intramembrane metalloprotease [Lachnospiraceae bacterium]